MKKFKRIMALVIALAMVLGMTSIAAFADDAAVEDGTNYQGDTHSDTTWTGTADAKISVSGLEEGDTVKFYKVLDYDQDAYYAVDEAAALTTNGTDWGAASWKVISPFTDATNGITLNEFKAILTTGISSELAGKIGKLATGTADITETADADGLAEHTFASTETPAGLYVAIITPAKAGVMYNPIFVASDYYTTTGGDKSSTWEPVTTPLSYSDSAMAKKSDITVTKTAAENAEATNETDAAKAIGVGDQVDFTVATTIPEFADNYTAPLFVVSDTMTSGLAMVENSVKVYPAGSTTELPATTELEGGNTRTNYKVTYTGTTEYKVTFNPAYLLTLDQATAIEIKYSATVTEEALDNVNVEENTVTVEYSHEPSVDEEGEGKKVKDKTHHYSFTIDGNIFGSSTENSTEVVKVGIDKNGNEITRKTVNTNDTTISVGALANAEFKLYTDSTCNTEYSKGAYADTTATDSGNKIVSDADGRLKLNGATATGIPGLDAGTYWLKEEKAPDGYIKQQNATKIEIIPTFYTEVKWTDADGSTITSDDVMKSYVVKVDGVQVAEYVLHYEYKDDKTEADADRVPVDDVTTADADNMKTTDGDIVFENQGPVTTSNGATTNTTGKILNTQGTELPSTGGIGTTIFYIVGAILVIGAGVVLITRRRMDA